jgi:hypothetical protein
MIAILPIRLAIAIGRQGLSVIAVCRVTLIRPD